MNIKKIVWLVCFLLLSIPIAGGLYLRCSLTSYQGNQQLADLQHPVSVVYDKHAVPHIEAKSLLDAARVQGYVHAQHRLWQMEMFRMTAQGRLSEIFGEKTLQTDIFLRTLGFKRYAEKSFGVLQDNTRAVLEAYTEGINAYLEFHENSLVSRLSPEFTLLRHQPEPWQPWHSLLTVKLMDLTLSANMRPEINRLAFAARGLSPEEINDLIRYAPDDNPPALPDLRKIFGFPTSLQTTKKTVLPPAVQVAQSGYKLPWPIGVSASNNWVVSGQRTESGFPLLTNDPHLGLTTPSTFYLNHLSYQQDGKSMNMTGASIPSIPLVLLGRNDQIAWGFTTSYLDSQDLFIEKLKSEDVNQYLTEHGWQNFEQTVENINIKNAEPYALEIKHSRHGPVLPEDFQGMKESVPEGHVVALQWTSLTEKDTTLDALVGITRATSVEHFKQALKPMVSPMQTIVVADVEGNIGMIAPSQIVVRHPENQIKGRAPVPGWLPLYAWQDKLEHAEWPSWKNPEQGVLFSANYKFVDDDYPHHLSYDWARQYRHYRIQAIIQGSSQKHTVNSMLAGVTDDYSPPLVLLRDAVLPVLQQSTDDEPELLDALQQWDGRMNMTRPEPLVMMGWFKQLADHILIDELGDDFVRINRELDINIVLNILAGNAARDWCDDLNTTYVESCEWQIHAAFKHSHQDLQQAYGANWQQWQWGKAHIAYNEHRPFAKVEWLAKWFNTELESGGGPYTLLRGQTSFNAADPFYNRAGAAYRAVYDFANLEQSLFIQNTGQSGHVMSPQYKDYAHYWAQGDFVPMWIKAENYQTDSLGKWTFKNRNYN